MASTEQQTIDELAGSNAFLRSVLDASSRVSIIVTDVDGTIRIFNEGARQLLGYQAAEVVGKRTPQIIHLEDEVKARSVELTAEFGRPIEGFEVFVAHAREGRYEEREWTYICKGGAHRRVNLAVTAVRDDEGQIVGFLGTAVDVTERVHMEERLRTSEQLFRRLFEDSADALLLLENDQFVDCNEGTVRMLRARNKLEVLNTPPWELSPGQQMDGRPSREKALEMIAIALERGSNRFEWLHRRMDGEVFPVEVLLTKIVIGDRLMLHTCWRDISDRKRAEEQLRQSQKMEVVGQLAGGVAHDFNNMLAVIVGGADLLTAELTDQPDLLENLQLIAGAARRAADLTSKLLAFARKGPESVVPTDVHDVVRAVSQLLARTLGKRVDVRTELNARRSVVMGDKTELENMVMNLGVNARDAIRGSGRLTLATEDLDLVEPETRLGAFCLPPGPYVRISVTDTGRGIEPELLRHIFEPFFTTKGVGEGTGLGLASVFGTAKSHHGAVDVRSQLGKGTTFEILLPVANLEVDEGALHSRHSPAVGGGTVLLVDDEPLVRQVLRNLLRAAGFTVLTADGVEEAEAVVRDRSHEIDAVVMDMIMPKVTGREGFHRLRAIDPDARIVLVSGFTRGEEVTDLMAEGLAGFLRKPVERDELLELLRKLVDATDD